MDRFVQKVNRQTCNQAERPNSRQASMQLLVAVSCLLLLFTPNLNSQEVVIGTATATVVSAITASATASIAFGTIYQGVPTTVANNDATAAIFELTGQTGSGLSVTMQLPEYLALADGSDRMTISFGSTSASIDTTGAGDPTAMAGSKGWQNVNPYSLPTALMGSSGTDIYLGGKVLPSIFQSAGSYSGDIIITITYNGT